MTDGNAIRDRILDRAGELFHQFGFKRVTMDDIAHALGMSKKTLYVHLPGKDALVEAFMMRFMEHTFSLVEDLFDDDDDVVTVTNRLLPFIRDRLSRISPVMMADMQRHYPHLWERINERRMMVLQRYLGHIERDRELGLIREEINPTVMVRIISTVVQEVANPTTFLEMGVPIPEVMETFITMMMRGALTEQGRARLEEDLT